MWPGWQVAPAEREAGEYYRRVFRGSHIDQALPPISATPDADEFASSLQQAESLAIDLGTICRTVHPAVANMGVFGVAIRNLLILACTEVEAQWSGILRANGYVGGSRWSTNDYVKLKTPLMLDRYEVVLRSFPAFPALAPFAGWDPANPTRSLAWYDAYNRTKHDRSASFHLATLHHAVLAVAAVNVLLRAQFGSGAVVRFSMFYETFGLTTSPRLPAQERTYPPRQDGAWIAVPFPF